MRFYNVIHAYHCGFNLDARNMSTCVLGQQGNTLLHRKLRTDLHVFLNAIAPFRDELRLLHPTGQVREKLFRRANPPAQRYLDKLRKKHGKAKSLSILAHKLGRAVYFMMKNRKPFSMDAFRIA